VRRPSPAEGRDRRLAPDEEKKLFEILDAHSNPMLGWVVRIALLTGMRQGEILSLRKKQVDLERRVVRLDQTKNGDSRVVPLSREVVTVFQTALDHPMRKSVRAQLVFYGDPGKDKRRRPYRVNKAWAEAVKRAGLEDLRFHDLRHGACLLSRSRTNR
jgi:integrase